VQRKGVCYAFVQYDAQKAVDAQNLGALQIRNSSGRIGYAALAQSMGKKERPPRRSATGVEKAFAVGRSLSGD